MQSTVVVLRVGFLNGGSYGESMQRLQRAAASNGVSDRSLRELIHLTAMAHGTGQEGDIVSMTVPLHVMEELEMLRLARRSGDDRIDLI